MTRSATLTRTTSETDVSLSLDLDGTGVAKIATGLGFFDHMLTAFARHGMLDLTVSAKGDLHIDGHHTTEDVGIVLGQAVARALGDKRGVRRFGHAVAPMDEALAEAAIDLSGRGLLVWDVAFKRATVGDFDTELAEEFFRAFATNALLTLHVTPARRAQRASHGRGVLQGGGARVARGGRNGPPCCRRDPVDERLALGDADLDGAPARGAFARPGAGGVFASRRVPRADSGWRASAPGCLRS